MTEIEYLKWLVSNISDRHSYLKPFARCLHNTLDDMSDTDIRSYYGKGFDDTKILKVCAMMSSELGEFYNFHFIDEVFSALEKREHVVH